MTYAVALACVLGLAVGQVLFRSSALAMNQAGTVLDLRALAILGTAVAVYGITTLGWVWVLRQEELGRVYPLMALAFILVPVASHFVFGEAFSPTDCVGIGLVVVGLVVALRPA